MASKKGRRNSIYVVKNPEEAALLMPELEKTDGSLAVIEEVDIGDTLALLKRCCEKNQALRRLLLAQEKSISYLLERCHKEQNKVEMELRRIAQNIPGGRHLNFVFGMPYFKDTSMYPAPCNTDAHERESLQYFDDFDVPIVRLWTDKDKRIVEQCIEAYEKEKIMKEIKETLSVLEQKIVECGDLELKKQLESLHAETLAERKNINNYSLRKLVGDRRDEYDWMKMSVVDLNSCHTPEECRSIWFNYLHPSINKNKWSESEDTKLKLIATKHRFQDWDSIARDLDTGRSGYQCMCHYYIRLNECMVKCKWTEEESKYLQKLVSHFQVGNYIPWGKVTCYLDGRAKHQVYSHWCYVASPNIRKGKFTREEDVKIVAAVREWGLDFGRIARLLPNRTSVQIRQRFNTILTNQRCPPPWTQSDDMLILKMIKEKGCQGQWKKIAEHFPFRTNQQVRFRYVTIKKWLKRNPGVEVPAINSRSAKAEYKNAKLTKSVEAVSRRKGSRVSQDVLSYVSNGLLSKITKRRGRRAGQLGNPSQVDTQYGEYLRCSFSQTGGKAKFICKSEKVPEMAHRLCHALKVLQADLTLPSAEEIEENDFLSPIDKSILDYFLSMNDSDLESLSSQVHAPNSNSDSVSPKPSTSDVTESTVVQSSNSATDEHNYGARRVQHLCPPNFSTMIGLRTFLLSRSQLQNAASMCDADFENFVFDHPEAETANQLWLDRLESLFTWAGYMSSIEPVCPNEASTSSGPKIRPSVEVEDEMSLISRKRRSTGKESGGRGKAKKSV